MFNFFSGFIAWRYTLSNRNNHSMNFMSSVAMIGIVLGSALLILVLSIMNGFDKELRERILAIMPQVTLYQHHSTVHASLKGSARKTWQSLREQMLQHDDIAAVAPFVELQGMVNVGNNTQPLLLYGVTPTLEKTVSIVHHFMNENFFDQLENQSNTIILGSAVAKKLSVNVGDTINLIVPSLKDHSQTAVVRRVTLLEIFDSGTEVDHSLALLNMGFAQSLSATPDDISGLHIKINDFFQAPRIAAELRSQLSYGYYTSDWTQTHGNIYYAIQMSKKLVSLLVCLIIAIAVFNVVSTLMMIVIDKQGDIAVLRTLGASTQHVMMIFVVQGVLVTVIGLCLGVMLGVLLSLNISDIVIWLESLLGVNFLQSDVYPISYLPSALQWQDIVNVVLITLCIAFLATVYPALRATKVEPASVLRYE